MSCREYRRGLMELARGGELATGDRQAAEAHVLGCVECRRFLEAQSDLSSGMAQLAAEAIPSSHEFASAAMAEFDRVHAPKVRAGRIVWRWAAGLGLAAALAVGVLTVTPKDPVRPAAQVTHLVAPAVDLGTFVPIPNTVPLAPEERVTVTRMDIPISALIAVGFDVPARDASALVRADVLVSQDGRARAIRPVTESDLQ